MTRKCMEEAIAMLRQYNETFDYLGTGSDSRAAERERCDDEKKIDRIEAALSPTVPAAGGDDLEPFLSKLCTTLEGGSCDRRDLPALLAHADIRIRRLTDELARLRTQPAAEAKRSGENEDAALLDKHADHLDDTPFGDNPAGKKFREIAERIRYMSEVLSAGPHPICGCGDAITPGENCMCERCMAELEPHRTATGEGGTGESEQKGESK